jgi:osmotically-inducible protein OsmY
VPEGGATADIPDDAAIQAEIDKRIADDPNFSKLDITATVTDGKVILVGTVPTNELRTRIEKLVRAVKGVKDVDNQIVVVTGT